MSKAIHQLDRISSLDNNDLLVIDKSTATNYSTKSITKENLEDSLVRVTSSQSSGNVIGSVNGVELRTGDVGSDVEVTQVQHSGTKIASIKVGNSTTDLYAPTSSSSGSDAWDCLYSSDGTIGSKSGNMVTLNKIRSDYTGLVFVFKKSGSTEYATIFKTNEEIDLVIVESGELILDRLLSGTAPVVGNGRALSLSDSTTQIGVIADSAGITYSASNYGSSIGSEYVQDSTTIGTKAVGVPTKSILGNNLEYSGLITDLDSITPTKLTAITLNTVTFNDTTSLEYIYGLTLSGSGGQIGGGGVIDGNSFELIGGDQSDNHRKTILDKIFPDSMITGELLYTVQNDCGLYMECQQSGGNDIECKYFLDEQLTKPIYKTTESTDNNLKFQGTIIPLKAGCNIYGYAPTHTGSSYPRTFTFIEYKLNSLNPQIAFPDYDKEVIINSSNRDDNDSDLPSGSISSLLDNTGSYTFTDSGYVVILHEGPTDKYIENGHSQDYKYKAFINEKPIYSSAHYDNKSESDRNGWDGTNYNMYSVSSGDTLRIDAIYYHDDARNSDITHAKEHLRIKFYPVKSVVQDANSVIELLYPVGSIYFDGNDNNVCPLEAVISGSTWEAVGTKLLTDGSTAPVVGNGKALVLTDGTNTKTLSNGASGIGASRTSDLITVGASADCHYADLGTDKGIGVSTDPTKSSLQVDLSFATGLSVKIWKRIS